MADWNIDGRARRTIRSRGADRGVAQQDSREFEHDDVGHPSATGPSVNTPTSLGALFPFNQMKDPRDSPTSPFAFVSSPRRQPFYSSSNGGVQPANDPTWVESPTSAPSPSLGSPAKRSTYSRAQSVNGKAMKMSESTSNCSSPSAGRTSPYARTKAMNARSFGRGQTFGGKHGQHWNHQMDAVQSQLYNTMRTLGVDHQTIMERLQRLKELHVSRGELSTPDSPIAGTQPSLPVEDNPAQASTIALLKHRFAQLEKFKESSECQQIPLYPSQNSSGGQSPSGPRSSNPPGTPTYPPRCNPSPRSTSRDASYEFDETTTALLALQQEMMWNSCGRSSASGNSDLVSSSNDSMGSPSPNWCSAASGDDSPTSSNSIASRGDDTPMTLAPHRKLPPLQVGRQSNLRAFQEASLRGAAMGNKSSAQGGCGPTDTLISLFAAEKMEYLTTTKIAPKNTHHQPTKFASSVEMALAKLSFSRLAPKVSHPKWKVHGGAWGSGLSLKTPVFANHSGRGSSSGTGVPESVLSNVHSSNNRAQVECPDICMEPQELIDTSLRL